MTYTRKYFTMTTAKLYFKSTKRNKCCQNSILDVNYVVCQTLQKFKLIDKLCHVL